MKEIPFGTGVYRESQAARLLRVRSRTIRRWWRGYRYRPYPGAPERLRPPVGRTERDLPVIHGSRSISFLEFAELVVVVAFVHKGVPLQRVRRAADILIHEYGVDRPFAYRRIFTDGHDIFMSLSQQAKMPDLIKLTSDERLQVRAGSLDEPFVEEISFGDKPPNRAEAFYPCGRDVPIVVSPDIAFGRPVIMGTRITTEAITELVRGSSVDEAVAAYGLPRATVLAAIRYEDTLSQPA